MQGTKQEAKVIRTLEKRPWEACDEGLWGVRAPYSCWNLKFKGGFLLTCMRGSHLTVASFSKEMPKVGSEDMEKKQETETNSFIKGYKHKLLLRLGWQDCRHLSASLVPSVGRANRKIGGKEEM